MKRKLSRRSFLGLALTTGAALAGCALPQVEGSTTSESEDLYRAPPLQPEEVDGSTVERSEEEWRELLAPFQYYVMREKGTERAFTGEYYAHKATGTYHCSACGNPLFASETKYQSGTGWPSFWAPLSEEYVATEQDLALGMARTEVLCARCGSHLGHVFNDGPQPTGLRYCINSVALNFSPAEAPQDGA